MRRFLDVGAVYADQLNKIDRRRYVIGGAPTLASSPFGAALKLGGADYLDLTHEEERLRFDAGTQDFSISVWVKTNTSGTQFILDKRDNNNDGWILLQNGDNVVSFVLDATSIVGVTTINDDKWHHVACVIDRSGNGQIYLDGVTDGAAVAIGGNVMATTIAPRIGARSFSTATSFYTGQLSGLVIFPRILSLQEITNLAANKSFDYLKFLIAHWDMSTINPPDICWRGNRYPGTGVNTPVVVPGIGGGKALEFDGNNQHVNVGDVLELNAVAKFSLSFWMNQDVIDIGDWIFKKLKDSDEGIDIRTVAAGGLFRVTIEDVDNTFGTFNYSTVMSAGHWHFVTVVYDGSGAANADRLKVYVDGNPVTLSFTGTIPAATPNLVGQDTFIGNTASSFDGKIDEPMIFNQPLTNMQVADLMNLTKRGKI